MAIKVRADEILEELYFSPEAEKHPFPLYRVLHELGPIHRWEKDGCWYATGYEAVRELLHDPKVGHDDERLFRRPGMTADLLDRMRNRMADGEREPGFSMISENPPSHTRMRRLVSRAFTTPRIEKLRERVVQLVRDRLDELAEAGEGDAMRMLAFPLPVTVISDLVGVPESEREIFRKLADGLSGVRAAATEEELKETEQIFTEIEDFFKVLIKERRANPEDDLMSALIAVRDEDDGRLSDQELRDTVVLLYFAGFITTSSLIGNGLLALGNHPAQMADLWADESLVVPAIEEFLRYDPPVDNLLRDVLEPTEIAGVPLDVGEHVFFCIGAANHDPARFTEPDVLDLRRPDNASLSFGWGIHHCLGAPLARLEAQVTFAQLRERFAPIEVLDLDPDRIAGIVRRPKTLPVRIKPV